LKGQQHSIVSCAPEQNFTFTNRPRKLPSSKAIPFRWPAKLSIAGEYISYWKKIVAKALGQLKLSQKTMEAIASHTSRRDGSCRLTDKALSCRTGRSLASTKRDIKRLKELGFIVAEYEGVNGRRKRVRLLKIAVPEHPRSSQRIPQKKVAEVASTYPTYVDPLDKGERRNV
jgi:hypothetical protein